MDSSSIAPRSFYIEMELQLLWIINSNTRQFSKLIQWTPLVASNALMSDVRCRQSWKKGWRQISISYKIIVYFIYFLTTQEN